MHVLASEFNRLDLNRSIAFSELNEEQEHKSTCSFEKLNPCQDLRAVTRRGVRPTGKAPGSLTRVQSSLIQSVAELIITTEI